MKLKVGKQLPQAVYIHKDYIEQLPDVLRNRVHLATAMVGDTKKYNLVKVSKKEDKVSFMTYTNFDSDPHPSLRHSTVVDVGKDSIKEVDYSKRENPPILHRKETFVGEDYTNFKKFRSLTVAEEKEGLLSRNDIGTKKQWRLLLDTKGFKIKRHRLTKSINS